MFFSASRDRRLGLQPATRGAVRGQGQRAQAGARAAHRRKHTRGGKSKCCSCRGREGGGGQGVSARARAQPGRQAGRLRRAPPPPTRAARRPLTPLSHARPNRPQSPQNCGGGRKGLLPAQRSTTHQRPGALTPPSGPPQPRQSCMRALAAHPPAPRESGRDSQSRHSRGRRRRRDGGRRQTTTAATQLHRPASVQA